MCVVKAEFARYISWQQIQWAHALRLKTTKYSCFGLTSTWLQLHSMRLYVSCVVCTHNDVSSSACCSTHTHNNRLGYIILIVYFKNYVWKKILSMTFTILAFTMNWEKLHRKKDEEERQKKMVCPECIKTKMQLSRSTGLLNEKERIRKNYRERSMLFGSWSINSPRAWLSRFACLCVSARVKKWTLNTQTNTHTRKYTLVICTSIILYYMDQHQAL